MKNKIKYICKDCKMELNDTVMSLVYHLAQKHNKLMLPSKALEYYDII